MSKLKAHLKENAQPLEDWEEFKQEMTNPTTPGSYRVQVIARKDSAALPGNLQWVSNQIWRWDGYWVNSIGIKVTDTSVIRGWEKIEDEN